MVRSGRRHSSRAVRIGGQEHAAADVLAREVEERLRRLQDRRVDRRVAGAHIGRDELLRVQVRIVAAKLDMPATSRARPMVRVAFCEGAAIALMRRGRLSTATGEQFDEDHGAPLMATRRPRSGNSVCVPSTLADRSRPDRPPAPSELRLGLFLQMLLAAFFQLGELRAEDQVLDRAPRPWPFRRSPG